MADVLKIENAHIIFRNFAGREGQYNHDRLKSFSVVIDNEQMVDELTADGWNIKPFVPKGEDDPEPIYHLPVAVSWKNIPPKIVMITGGVKTFLDEESVECLDYADIRSIDLIINPSYWNKHGEEGIKAYLKTMYVVIEEDEFAAKYENL